MKRFLNILPYICIVAYVIFIFFSVDACDKGMEDFYDIPYNVTREVREMRARLQTMRNTLPTALASSNLNFMEIEKILNRHNALQDTSLNALRERIKNDSGNLLSSLEDALHKLRMARINVAHRLENNTSYDIALSHYNTEIEPYVNDVNMLLLEISRLADRDGLKIRQEFFERHDVTKFAAVGLGLFLILILLYNSIKDKQKSKVIEHREKLFNLLSQNIDDIFLISDDNGEMEYVSPNSKRVLHLSSKEIMEDTEKLYSLLDIETRVWLKNILHDFNECHVEEKQADNIKFNQKLKVRIYPICEHNGKFERHITVISDETEERRRQNTLNDALQSARNANAAKSSFLAHMSHEIRTPMNAIMGMTFIAQNRIEDKVRVVDCLEKISESSRHLLGIINDVLDMTKIDSGKLTLAHENFNLEASLQTIVNFFQQQVETKKQHFEITIKGDVPANVYGDSLRLQQIVINLIGNAIKFTPQGGNIDLVVESAERKSDAITLRFIVRDTGIGMTPEFLKRMYEPFVQAVPGTIKKFAGAGLGLAITKNLVTLLNGTISAVSHVGEGTEFKVELPFALGNREKGANDEEGTPHKILVVDDNPDSCEQATEILGKMGLKTEWTLNGYEAIQMVKKAMQYNMPYDLCLLDWQMPDLDGCETARQIKNICGDKIKIIIGSAVQWESIKEVAIKAGVSGYIGKPFSPGDMKNIIQDVIRQAPVPSPESQAGHKEEKNYDFSGKRALLVEDNEFNREIAQEFLEMVNMEVEYAENGKEGKDKFIASSSGYYDLILMDIQMPEMNGYDASRAIRASDHPDARTIPILAMTANAFKDDIAAAMEAGMNVHIAKPIDIHILYKAMEEVLNMKK